MGALSNFVSQQVSLTSPAYSLVAYTPSDSAVLPNTARAIHVSGTGGTIAVSVGDSSTSSSVTIYVAQGGLFPVLATKIWATGTTATGIVVAY